LLEISCFINLGLDPALTAKNIHRMVQICRENGVTVILAGMSPVPAFGVDEAAFTRLYPTIAEEEAIILIPSFLEGVVGNSVLTQADGVHPTAAGYKVVAETVYSYVLEATKQLL
jgi:acyl-CoA thioesterase-1